MSYEINVSQHGNHYFATHERSLRCGEELAIRTAQDMRVRFPKSEGFEVSLSHSQKTCSYIEIPEVTA
tara:strand:- start:418 stop:621 length:204 start_codon:yes stop_codon:yes gene_type:complete